MGSHVAAANVGAERRVVFEQDDIKHLGFSERPGRPKAASARLPCEGTLLQLRPAEMQMLNWNDLRYVLAVSRGGTLRAAARLLGVDDTTVPRRLVAMQEMIGTRLYQRLVDGTLQLTTSGERAALHAERIEREVGALAVALAGADEVISGTVRITSVPIVVNHILVPAAPILLKRHPKLEL